MSVAGRLATGAGVAAALGGLLLVVAPGFAAGVGVDRAFVLFVGAFAAVQVVVDVRARRAASFEAAETGDPERRSVPPPAGSEVDDLLAAASTGFARDAARRRNEVRDRVEAVAVTVLVRQEDCSREDAFAMLDDGSWTDDPHAAAFFGAEPEDGRPLREVLGSVFAPAAQFRRQATRAVHELDRRRES